MEIVRLNQIQYIAAKLASGALHLTSQIKLNLELGWETISERAEFLGLSIFHKIHLFQTRPLIQNCMPLLIINNNRSQVGYQLFQSKYVKYSNFPPH